MLIGDREAEDTSDLSDVASEYGETETAPAINSILVDSKTVIGGKNLLNFEDVDSGPEEEDLVEPMVNGKGPKSTDEAKTNGGVVEDFNGIVLTGEGK